MNEKKICPNCEMERLAKPIREKRTLKIRGEPITVPVSLYRCLHCGEEFENRSHPIDELDLAYREYRSKHKMMQPEEIRVLREEIGLTQSELAQLLGWSPATISRYENGSLQEFSHDNMLQSLKEPVVLMHLLERSESFFLPKRFNEIKSKTLQKLYLKQTEYLSQGLELEGKDIYSGNEFFNQNKYLAATQRIITKCPGDGVPKTKLNKLLFYSDFLSFKQKGKSITGARYEHIAYGPCPKDYQSLLGLMVDRDDLSIQIKTTKKEGYEVELIQTKGNVKTDILSEEEKNVVDAVCHKLGKLTSKELTDLSHKEEGYKQTKNGDLISFKFAKSINI